MKQMIVLFGLSFPALSIAAETCHYQSYRWNTHTQQAVDFVTVEKPYEQLDPDEIDPLTGCSVCIEDQRRINVGYLEPVWVCKHLASQIEWILNTVDKRGFPINQLKAYQVGRTRGDIDNQGRRTGFSNHSYGVAIDVNSASNGLYVNCINFGGECVLRLGGEWRPGINPQSITADSLLVKLMKQAGFKWGGEIAGKQKDFMHFSISGY